MQVMADTRSFVSVCFFSSSFSFFRSVFSCIVPFHSFVRLSQNPNTTADSCFMCECFALPFMQHWLNDDVFMVPSLWREYNRFAFHTVEIFFYLVVCLLSLCVRSFSVHAAVAIACLLPFVSFGALQSIGTDRIVYKCLIAWCWYWLWACANVFWIYSTFNKTRISDNENYTSQSVSSAIILINRFAFLSFIFFN